MRVISVCSAAVAALLWCGVAGAQTAAAPAPQPKPLPSSIASHPDWPKAKKADVESVDALMAALYDVISGPRASRATGTASARCFCPMEGWA